MMLNEFYHTTDLNDFHRKRVNFFTVIKQQGICSKKTVVSGTTSVFQKQQIVFSPMVGTFSCLKSSHSHNHLQLCLSLSSPSSLFLLLLHYCHPLVLHRTAPVCVFLLHCFRICLNFLNPTTNTCFLRYHLFHP